jgi:hypothetical protein
LDPVRKPAPPVRRPAGAPPPQLQIAGGRSIFSLSGPPEA